MVAVDRHSRKAAAGGFEVDGGNGLLSAELLFRIPRVCVAADRRKRQNPPPPAIMKPAAAGF